MKYSLLIDTTGVASFRTTHCPVMWMSKTEFDFTLPVDWELKRQLEVIAESINEMEVVPYENLAGYEDVAEQVAEHLRLVADVISKLWLSGMGQGDVFTDNAVFTVSGVQVSSGTINRTLPDTKHNVFVKLAKHE